MKRDLTNTAISLCIGFLIGYPVGMTRQQDDFESCMKRNEGKLSDRVTACQGFWDREWVNKKGWRQ